MTRTTPRASARPDQDMSPHRIGSASPGPSEPGRQPRPIPAAAVRVLEPIRFMECPC